jgi:hypothetical protein
MTYKRPSSTAITRQSLVGGKKQALESRGDHFERSEERLFQSYREYLADLLNGVYVKTITLLGHTAEHELVKVEDREKVSSLFNKLVTSLKQIQETLSLKPPLSSVPNQGGIHTIASHLSQQLKDRCEEEIDEINRLLEKLTVRPWLYLAPEGRSVEVRIEASPNREFSYDVANALLTVMRLIERKELDTLRRCDCGKWYFASRSDQKSCSATCRQRRHARSPEFRATRRAYRKTLNEMKKQPKKVEASNKN